MVVKYNIIIPHQTIHVDASYKKNIRLSIHILVLYYLDLLKKYLKKLGFTQVISNHPSFRLT